MLAIEFQPHNFCSDFALESCADWILAPAGDPNLRPHVVNNSWGSGGGDSWYQDQVNAWRAAGIFPAFAAGNSGSSCGTLGSPGDYQTSFGSAAHDASRNIAGFSSRGPSAFGDDPYTKPNLSAPGVDVCSAVPGDGWSCGYSGTSMASPHTAGAVALLWSCNPALRGAIDQTFQILQGATDAAPAGDCGAPPSGSGNYTYGRGYLNVLAAGLSHCGPTGTLDGYARSAANNQPIAGAQISAQLIPTGVTPDAVTDPNGYFSMPLPTGGYTVTATAFGFLPGTLHDVQIAEDATTSVNFALQAAPSSTVSGVITDSATGWPLYARIDIGNGPANAVWSDPATGQYSVTLPQGTAYEFVVSSAVAGYHAQTRPVGPLTGDRTEHFPLAADLAACTAPGYDYTTPLFFENFEAGYAAWTLSGLWNGQSQSDACGALVAPFPSPGNAAYYGDQNACNFNVGTNSGSLTLNTPVTLAAAPPVVLSLWSFEQTEKWPTLFDKRYVELSNDGGNTWSVLGELSDEDAWYRRTFDLSAYVGQAVRIRFRFDSVDDIANYYFGWMVDDIRIDAGSCQAPTGGLVVGNVYDGATPVVGARVTTADGRTATAAATPDDPAVDDAFYTIYSPAGIHDLTASHAGYENVTHSVNVPAGGAVRRNFQFGAYTLTVSKAGTGSGTVTSNPAGIRCGPDCSASSADYDAGAVVTLTAIPGTHMGPRPGPMVVGRFVGWSGACAGSGRRCQVTMDAAKEVTAIFSAR